MDIYISKESNNSLEKLIKHTCSTISCKYSPKAGDKLSLNDMQTLLDLLEEENILTNCPHGRPFVLRLSKDYLDKKFFRWFSYYIYFESELMNIYIVFSLILRM